MAYQDYPTQKSRMDMRSILVVVLLAIVIIVTPLLFPSSKPAAVVADTSAARATTAAATTAPAVAPAVAPTVGPAPAVPVADQRATVALGTGAQTTAPRTPAETLTVASPTMSYQLSSLGAAPVRVVLPTFGSLRPKTPKTDRVTLAEPAGTLLDYRLLTPTQNIALDTVAFTATHDARGVTFTSAAPALTIAYTLDSTGYVTHVRGTMPNAPAGTRLEVALPSTFQSNEADTLDDQRHFAYAYHIHLRDVTSVGFGKLDPTESRADTGAIDWVSARDKYFLITLIQPKGGRAFTGVQMHGGPRVGKLAPNASAFAVQPLVNGAFGFDLYAGPQAIEQLGNVADDLNNVNPYGSFMRPIVQPFTTITLKVLLWMKRSLVVNYGWVLILFGVLIRLALWPLNQRAMRSGIQMQRIQPQIQEAQKKYKGDAAKMQEETMRIYREHGMSPLSPLLGCLPMMLPMPILFALYYVFQNTIEFRGVPFLWMSDLSLRDPYYITPIAMGISMFLLSWLGMRNSPPNPQTKMMSFMMPAVFTAMFMNLASGLNLYYAVQNLTSLPQQWMLSRERAKSNNLPVVRGTPSTNGRKGGGSGGGGGNKRNRV